MTDRLPNEDHDVIHRRRQQRFIKRLNKLVGEFVNTGNPQDIRNVRNVLLKSAIQLNNRIKGSNK